MSVRYCRSSSWSLIQLIMTYLIVVVQRRFFILADDLGSQEKASGDYIPLNCNWNFTYTTDSGELAVRYGEIDGTQWINTSRVSGIDVLVHGKQMSLGHLPQEFSTPNYPSNYNNRSDCVALISAPIGHRIRLDFVDNFYLEHSPMCDYDFVELRNGPFGYSPLLGRYCGQQRPSSVESTGRHLWIRFKSDQDIEYQGFKAVYEFIRSSDTSKKFNAWESPSREHYGRAAASYFDSAASSTDEGSKYYFDPCPSVCRLQSNSSNHQGVIDLSTLPPVALQRLNITRTPLDCTWIVHAPPTHRVYIRWAEYHMSAVSNRSCEESFLELYDRSTALSNKRRTYCGAIARDLPSTSNLVFIRLFSKSTALLPIFTIHFTFFVDDPCDDNMFSCGDHTCVDKSLVCNGQVNCNHSWDELVCNPTTEGSPSSTSAHSHIHTLVILIIVCTVTLTAVVICTVTCCQRRREIRRRRQAYKQDQRQAFEIELTNLLYTTTAGSASASDQSRIAGRQQLGARSELIKCANVDVSVRAEVGMRPPQLFNHVTPFSQFQGKLQAVSPEKYDVTAAVNHCDIQCRQLPPDGVDHLVSRITAEDAKALQKDRQFCQNDIPVLSRSDRLCEGHSPYSNSTTATKRCILINPDSVSFSRLFRSATTSAILLDNKDNTVCTPSNTPRMLQPLDSSLGCVCDAPMDAALTSHPSMSGRRCRSIDEMISVVGRSLQLIGMLPTTTCSSRIASHSRSRWADNVQTSLIDSASNTPNVQLLSGQMSSIHSGFLSATKQQLLDQFHRGQPLKQVGCVSPSMTSHSNSRGGQKSQPHPVSALLLTSSITSSDAISSPKTPTSTIPSPILGKDGLWNTEGCIYVSGDAFRPVTVAGETTFPVWTTPQLGVSRSSIAGVHRPWMDSMDRSSFDSALTAPCDD